MSRLYCPYLTTIDPGIRTVTATWSIQNDITPRRRSGRCQPEDKKGHPGTGGSQGGQTGGNFNLVAGEGIEPSQGRI